LNTPEIIDPVSKIPVTNRKNIGLSIGQAVKYLKKGNNEYNDVILLVVIRTLLFLPCQFAYLSRLIRQMWVDFPKKIAIFLLK